MAATPDQIDAAQRAFDAASRPPKVQSALSAAIHAQSYLLKRTDTWAQLDAASGIRQVLQGGLDPKFLARGVPETVTALRDAGRASDWLDLAGRGTLPSDLVAGGRIGSLPAWSAASAGQALMQSVTRAGLPWPGVTSAFDSIAAQYARVDRAGIDPEHASRTVAAGLMDAQLRATLSRPVGANEALMTTLSSVRSIGVLDQARSATAGFSLAAQAYKARLDTASSLTDRMFALKSGLATADLLGGRIEAAANRLDRLGVSSWGGLPAETLRTFGGLSLRSTAGHLDTQDLFAIARGAYAVTALSARAGAFAASRTVDDPLAGPDTAEDDADETVDEWSAGAVSVELHDALAALHPRLADKLRGAWDTYRRRGPDFLGQAGTSAVELIDNALRLLAPPADVLAYAQDTGRTGDAFITSNGNATLRLKLLFIMRDREIAADAVEAQIRALNKARKLIQGSKHTLEFDDEVLFGQQLLVVENVFTVILLG